MGLQVANTQKKNKTQGIINPSGYKVEPRLWDLNTAACYLGRSVYSLRTLLWNGELPCVKSGKKQWIDRLDLDRWIERNKTYIMQPYKEGPWHAETPKATHDAQ
jgi:excisionase family DNA binding protein